MIAPALLLRFRALALLLAAACATACHPVVTAPAPPPDPAAVYLAHYDFFHTSLVVPHPDGATEYTYGDWDVFARDRRTAWTKFKSVLLPSRGTLGRQRIAWGRHPNQATGGSADANLLAALHGSWKLSRYPVSRAGLLALTTRLDAQIEAARHTAVRRPGSPMVFVHSPQAYSLLHNCNHVLKRWLQQLGFSVRGPVALADFDTPDATHTYAPGREGGGMRTGFKELVGERPNHE